MKRPSPSLLLGLILVTYLILGALYATGTPAWQAPDEPAHYNYVRYLADHGTFPVLHPGDYPHAYLEEIKARRFPPEMSIDPIRYEYHQPPLYYALAAPVFMLARVFTGDQPGARNIPGMSGDAGGDRALLPLRLLSVTIGAGVVLLTFLVAREVFPGRPSISLGAAAFAAFLPQHLATVSQVGNDVLAELVVAAILLLLVRWVAPARPIRPLEVLLLGFLVGLALVTKTTAYLVAPLALGVLFWSWRREQARARKIARDLALLALPAIALALPWYARNAWAYGWPDILGLARHDTIVVGQPRTAEWIASAGLPAYLSRLSEFTFKSFWGVFGWLGVFMDSRIYAAVALLSLIAGGGLVLGLLRRDRIRQGMLLQTPNVPGAVVALGRARRGLTLLGTSALLSVFLFAWYNTQFVQHQGRYLFTALVPIATGFSLGWLLAVEPRNSRILAAGMVVLGVALAGWGILSGNGLPRWPLGMVVLAGAALLVMSELPIARNPALRAGLETLWAAAPYLFMVALALYGLFGAIQPQLAL